MICAVPAYAIQNTAIPGYSLPWYTIVLDLAGRSDAVSSTGGPLGLVIPLSGAVSGRSTAGVSIQWRGSVDGYVSAQLNAEPYPIPSLVHYVLFDPIDPVALGQWADRFSQWSEEHMIRIYREVSRLGQEKAAEWVDA